MDKQKQYLRSVLFNLLSYLTVVGVWIFEYLWSSHIKKSLLGLDRRQVFHWEKGNGSQWTTPEPALDSEEVSLVYRLSISLYIHCEAMRRFLICVTALTGGDGAS